MEEEEPVRIPVTDVFDLHSVPPRDVKAVVEEYLQEAHRMGLRALRIVHGLLLRNRFGVQDAQTGKIVLDLLEGLQHRLAIVGHVLLIDIACFVGEGMTTAGIE